MKRTRFAVIGCGLFAQGAHLPNLVSLEEAALEVCCDLNEENLAACARFQPRNVTSDFCEAIASASVDAIIVATTERFRLPIIEAAAAARKPVYVEKPIADTLENAIAVERIVRESGIPFCVGHNRRCSPAMMDARALFANHMRAPSPCVWRFEREGIGRVNVGADPGAPVVSIRINDDWKSWKPVHLEGELNGQVGLVLSEGTHFADLANWFIDSEPVTVFCSGYGLLNHAFVIRYANGGMATITVAATGSFGYPKELLEAMGNAGVVAVDHLLEVRTAGLANALAVARYPLASDRLPSVGQEGGLHGWLHKKRAACEEAERAGDPLRQFGVEPDRGHRNMIREFIREIHGEREPVSTAQSALLALRVCLAAARSLQEGRVVSMAEVG